MDFLSQLANYNTNHQDNNDNPNWIASSMPANPINSFSMPSSVHKLPGSTSHLDTTTYQDQVPFDNTAVSSTTDTTTTQSTTATTTTTTTLRTDKPKTSRSAKDKNRPKRKQVKNACGKYPNTTSLLVITWRASYTKSKVLHIGILNTHCSSLL